MDHEQKRYRVDITEILKRVHGESLRIIVYKQVARTAIRQTEKGSLFPEWIIARAARDGLDRMVHVRRAMPAGEPLIGRVDAMIEELKVFVDDPAAGIAGMVEHGYLVCE